MSDDSDVSTTEAQSAPGKQVVAKPVAEASVQVSLDLRIEDMKLTHSTQDQQMPARTQEVPQVSKQQKQIHSGKTTAARKPSQGSPVDLQQFTESVNKEARQLTELEGTIEDGKEGELAPAGQAVPPPRVEKSDAETNFQLKLSASNRGTKPAHSTQEQEAAHAPDMLLQLNQTTAHPRHNEELGVQHTQRMTQGAAGGGALDEVAQASEDTPLGKHDCATLLLGHPSGAPTRNFLLVEDIDPNDTLIADGGDRESTLKAGDPLDAADFTLREPMANSSMSDGSVGASQQHGVCMGH